MKPISREEVDQAIRAFFRHGGQVKFLPRQKNYYRTIVGAKHTAYELLSEFSQI